jgi:CBS domain-containing protein
MLNEEVRRVMTSDPVVVHPNDEIASVSQMMIASGIQQMPVVDEGNHLVGMLTTYDLWRYSRGDYNPKAKLVSDIMATNIIKITPKDKLGTAAELFMDKRFKTLPVVNLRNELKGVITAFDVMRQTLKDEYPRPILYSEIINQVN